MGCYSYITRYGSILYTAKVFVFTQYIKKFSSYFDFQVNLILEHRTCQNYIVYQIFHSICIAKYSFCHVLLLNVELTNSITVVSIDMKLGI